MARQNETGWDRLKALTLAHWGGIVIFAGLMTQMLGMVMSPGPATTAEQKGAAFGRAAAAIVFIVGGVVMIVLHFVLPKRRRNL